jgi:hypothetical protein
MGVRHDDGKVQAVIDIRLRANGGERERKR